MIMQGTVLIDDNGQLIVRIPKRYGFSSGDVVNISREE